jgi:beta-lactamase superfamily II metal-dependent hydrolase
MAGRASPARISLTSFGGASALIGVDLVVATHPHEDHIAGLRVVLSSLHVQELVLHRPWAHTSQILACIRGRRRNEQSFQRGIRRAFPTLCELDALAQRRGIHVIEPFARLRPGNGGITVLGPSLAFYHELVCEIMDVEIDDAWLTPAALARKAQRVAQWSAGAIQEFTQPRVLMQRFAEALGFEGQELDDWGLTDADNDSSVVLMLHVADRRLLFTGDVGIDGLQEALDCAALLRMPLHGLAAFQPPHHGSHHNVSGDLLDRLSGTNAIISAAADSADHPSPDVIDALRKRGWRVSCTCGKTLRIAYQAPA